MRAAVILGLGSSPRDLRPFQTNSATSWLIGMPGDSSEADAILVFGGDGTVHRHLPQLVRLQLPVLVVPAGSGNDFARALKIPNVAAARAAWRKLEGGGNNVRRIDLGTITPLATANEGPIGLQDSGEPQTPGHSALGIQRAAPGTRNAVPGTRHYFACVASCGLDSGVARRANQLPRWIRAHGGYALSLPAALLRFVPLAVKTSLRDPEAAGGFRVFYAGPTALVACANTPVYGGGLRIAPKAQMDDGHLDICHVKAINKLKLLGVFPTAYFGRHLGVREVEYFQTGALQLSSDAPTAIYADGEYVCDTPVEIGVDPGVFPVVAP